MATELPFFLQQISFEDLRQKGYIDSRGPLQNELSSIPLYPIFYRARLPNLSTTDYQLLLPALCLATKLFGETRLLPFWHAIFFASRRNIRNLRLEQIYGHPCQGFELRTGGITDSDVGDTRRRLRNLSLCVEFSFANLPDRDATTEPTSKLPGLSFNPNTRGALITLHTDYLVLFRAHSASSDFPSAAFPTIFSPPTPASILRTHFHLALTLLHELCHAANWSLTPLSAIQAAAPSRPPEPFVLDQRLAELGRAWETVVFGGHVFPVGGHPSAHFGLAVRKWPGLDRKDDAYWDRGPSREHWLTVWAVPMAWVEALWTKRFWEDVERFGVRELAIPRVLGVRRYQGDGVGQ